MESSPPGAGGGPPGAGGNPPPKKAGAPPPMGLQAATAAASFLKPAVPMQQTQKSSLASQQQVAMPPSGALGVPNRGAVGGAPAAPGGIPQQLQQHQQAMPGGFRPAPSTFGGLPPPGAGGVGAIKKPAAKKPIAGVPPGPFGAGAIPPGAMNNNGGKAPAGAPTIPPPSRQLTAASAAALAAQQFPKVNPMVKTAAAAGGSMASAPPQKMEAKKTAGVAIGAGNIVNPNPFIPGKSLPLTAKQKNDAVLPGTNPTGFKTIMPPPANAGKLIAPMMPLQTTVGASGIVTAKEVQNMKAQQGAQQQSQSAAQQSAQEKKKQMLMDQVTQAAVANANAAAMAQTTTGKKKKAPAKKKSPKATAGNAGPQNFQSMSMKGPGPMKGGLGNGPGAGGPGMSKPFVPFHAQMGPPGSAPHGGKGPPPPGSNGMGPPPGQMMAKMGNGPPKGPPPPPPVPAPSSNASVASATSSFSGPQPNDNVQIVITTPQTNNGNNEDDFPRRELKVEDALLYLDQVKLEFGDRPRIYNEFLEIMKNFKAQEVDTIGVINRVRRLFHGYNNLILGFNTFLPEGYKIEMRDLEPVFVGPGLPGTNHTPGFKPPPGPGGHPGGRGMAGRGPPQGRGMGPPTGFGRGGRGMPPGGRGMPPGRGPPPHGVGGRGLMPGRGGPPQLGGPGPGRGGMVPAPGRGGPMMAGRGPPPGPGGMKPSPAQQQMMHQAQNAKAKQAQMQQQQAQQQQQQAQQQQQQAQQKGRGDIEFQAAQNAQNAAATRTIEFDHAIMYVTNIKKRFANQPRIYHTFLEILHTYQKEQRGIKEVLEQVSSLFADHPDLLREFTFFLPDAVQEQAKERLSRAAAEAEAKQRAAAVEAAAKQQQQQVQAQQAQAMQQQQAAAAEATKSSGKSAPTGWRTTGSGSATPKGGKMGQRVGVEPLLPSGTQKFIDMTQPDEAGVESPTRRVQATAAPVAPSSGAQIQPPAQETYVYNAGVERQFFDLVKAALTSFSRDGQAYAEFIKTLDMYAQEILSRQDMLGYVERLLGKHKDLFEEFKRIINAVGSPEAPAHDDSWHSVPLSEIDFSRCRRCSPSYRALPRDYPNPPCSERSPYEVKVLNDVWVSLPMGSEENNTFRHMRKNQYEETLFRCEDMRFEIDMCIDSNAATLQRLIKIHEELQFLSENELLLTKGGTMVKKSLCPDGAGLGGKVYQYTLDGRVLGVIHKHAIRRIYGDDGKEMLDLCSKNPAVAIPIVVNRLRQKDEEFRSAREVLNRKWKDLAEHNYYKSVDHRSITWRTTDKRATSTRTIVAEIKDRAAHNGLEGEAAANARMEKMKEEHGTFYEVTMGYGPRKMNLTGLPRPTPTIFTPHMSFMYDNNSWAQQDAYRIISFALERGSISPGDKERCFRLWRDFIAPWFGLSLSWMQSPATVFTPSQEVLGDQEENEGDSTSTGDDNDEEKEINGNTVEMEDVASKSGSGGENDGSNNVSPANTNGGNALNEETMRPETTTMGAKGEVDDAGYFSTTNHIPFPPETLVSTTFGEGKVIQYLQDDGIYEVSYPSESGNDGDVNSSTAYLRPTAVYGSLFPVEPSLLTDQLRTNDPEVPKRPDDQLIIGTQCLYLFFRLHQVLIRRLGVAKKLAVDVSKDTALGRHIEKLTYENDPDEGKKRYDAFLGLVYGLVDASIGTSEAAEGGKYEDRVRHLLGNNAYELTTMDKLISHILKHLQNMANDDTLQNMIEIYRRHELAGNFKPSAFREEAALMSEGENMFAFQICNMPKTDQKISHCEFLGCIAEDVEEEEEEEPGAMLEENDDHKRGIDEVAMDDADDSAQAAKRSKRAA